MDPNIADHPVIRALVSEVDRLKKRVDALEYHLHEEHEKIERLEHEHEHDHEILERIDHTSSTSYYTGRKTIAVGL